MTIVRELVTKLSFKLDNTGLAEYSKAMSDIQQRAKSVFGGLQTSPMMQGMKALQDNLKAVTDSMPSLGMSPAVTDRIKELTSYSEELKGLSASERKDVLELNRIEKQAIREVAEQQRKAATEKRRLDAAERRSVAEKNRERKKTNFLTGLNDATRFANRALTGIFGVATASVGFSYKEYKNYKKNKEEGKVAKTSLTPEQIKQFEAFDKVANTSRETIANLRNAFSAALLPAITEVLKPFNEWYKLNKKIINTKLKDFATQLGNAFKTIGSVLGRVLPIIGSVINVFGGLQNVVLGLIGIKVAGWFTTIFGLLRTLAALIGLPLLPVIVLIGAFYLLYDEIKTTMEGGESYLRDFDNFLSKISVSIIGNFVKMTDAAINWLGISDKVESLRAHVKEREVLGIAERKKRKEEETNRRIRNDLGGILMLEALDPVRLAMERYNPATPDFMQQMEFANTSRNITNNITGGGVQISISTTGNIDDNAVKKLGKQISDAYDQKMSDMFSLAITNAVN